MKYFAALLLIFAVSAAVSAQTATPDIYVYATVEAGQLTRFDYTATAGSVHISNLLTLLLFSLWGMFLFAAFVYVRRGQK